MIKTKLLKFSDETDANNKETIDDPSKQKLSYEDIEQLKKDGLEGQVNNIDAIYLRVNGYSHNLS